MQLNQNIILPYPCLNLNISDNIDIPPFDFEVTHRNLAKTTFRVKVKTINTDIISLIENGAANYCLELDCRKAFYREAFLNNTGVFDITLINNRFNGKLIGTLSVVAVKDISNYKNSAFDDFYNSFTINISAGESLAYLGFIEMNMQEKSMEVKNIADDFIVVVKDESIKYSRFDLGGMKIVLKLPTNLYDKYESIQHSIDSEPFLHASFLLNVLTTALQSLGEYKDNNWAESLRNRIEIEDELRTIASCGNNEDDIFDEDGNLANPSVALDLAQAILNNPYERMFEGYENLKNQGDE